MNVCPICLFVNPASAPACARCGKFRFAVAGVAVLDPPAAADDPAARTRPEGGTSVITKPSGAVSAGRTTRVRPPDEAGAVAFGLPAKDGTAGGQGTAPTARVVMKPRLEVVRGEKLGVSFAVLEGKNILGRMVNAPVDIDLTGQEPPERVWTSRQHACVLFDGRAVILEDLNSLNGTFVNRQRVFPGQQRVLQPNDVIQVGTVQLRMLVSTETQAG